MRIVVTGGAGYIGSVCVELLCDSGHDVLVIDNLGEGHRAAVDPRASLEVLDLKEPEGLSTVLDRHGSSTTKSCRTARAEQLQSTQPGKPRWLTPPSNAFCSTCFTLCTFTSS